MMQIKPTDFSPLPAESYLPSGSAPSQLYNACKYAYDSEDFTLDGFADALREHTVAIRRMQDIAKPEGHEYKAVLEIADAAKAYRTARAALLAAQEAFSDAETSLSSLLDESLVDYCIDPDLIEEA
jgi:hypothetical protein